MSAGCSVINIRDARKQFGETTALDGATLSLAHGEWLALLGPNGAGKTTLVRAIAGRVRLDAGSISISGDECANDRSDSQHELSHRALGLVPQEIALFPLLNARENLESFASFHGLDAAEAKERTDWALEWTGLTDHARRPVRTFSGGMKRRLNLACGVLHRPEIILLDEPTAGVDPQSRERIWEMLQALREAGASLLHTTHNLHEAEEVCDRIVIIDHGTVIAAGTVGELISQTIGGSRIMYLTLNKPFDPDRLDGDGRRFDPVNASPDQVCCGITDFNQTVPELIRSLNSAGYEVRDMEVRRPTLHAVFLHLTGRELREG